MSADTRVMNLYTKAEQERMIIMTICRRIIFRKRRKRRWK